MAYYEFRIQEVHTYPSQRMIITEQNTRNYADLRIGTASPQCSKSRIKTLPPLKKDKIVPFEHDYNTAYRTIFYQRNLTTLIGGNKK